MAARADVDAPSTESTEPREGGFAALKRAFDRATVALRSLVGRLRQVGTAPAPVQPDGIEDPGAANPTPDTVVRGESAKSSGADRTPVIARRVVVRRFAAGTLIAIAGAAGIAGVWMVQRKSATAARDTEELRARLDAQTRELARTRRALEASETARAAARDPSALAAKSPPAGASVSNTGAPASAESDCSVSGANAGETLKHCIELFNQSMR